jgi:UDP-N-acetylglucosamine--N-acetylmuramyl-(pentapeptide) pyrophosphoryl-undecaprenol N-acetylglucosamine transferase
MKVYIGCFGSGLGHASRMLEVAKELRARNALVEFSSSGEVASLIRGHGYPCNDLPLADVRYSESGAFLLKETLIAYPTILARTYRQLGEEIANIGHFGPDVVLSDSALPTVLAAKILRVPAYTVLNQLNLTSSHGNKGVLSKLLSVGTSAGMGKLWEFSDEVLLPDLPPPYTISEKNLWGSNVEKTRYVGFLAPSEGGEPDYAAAEFINDERPKIFWQVSGPPKTRSSFLTMAMAYSEALAPKYSFVVSGGDPLASTFPTRFRGGWYYGWCGIAEFYFKACDLVVSRAGHGTIGQAILWSKPSLLVPIPKQPEQEGNAEKAVKLGVSIWHRQEELTVEVLEKSFIALLNGDYSTATKRYGDLARKFDAKADIVHTIEAASIRARRLHR